MKTPYYNSFGLYGVLPLSSNFFKLHSECPGAQPPTIIIAFLSKMIYRFLGFHPREKAEMKMETFSYRKSRIWEMKEDKNKKSLAKNQVYAVVHMRDIRKNVLPKFIKLCMETPCLCPIQGHKYGGRKPTEISVFQFSYL